MPAVKHAELARRSAEAIVPQVMDLLAPRSVCDVGCGRGIWLAVFRQHGADRVIGTDGDYIDPSRLEIDTDSFVPANLEEGVPIEGPFDLAVSLEVAEHLAESVAERFVEDLVRLAPAVLFSAAVPGQGGLDHVNEQWPDYWQALFDRHGYLAIDCIRPRIWDRKEVAFWYRQNTLLFAQKDLINSRESLKREYATSAGKSLSVVHPELFEIILQRLQPWYRVRELVSEVEAGRLDEQELEEEIARIVKRYADRARARASADRRFS
jgi:SAM-dependent methyltransferase